MLTRRASAHEAEDRLYRVQQLKEVARLCLQEWCFGLAVVFHCVQSFHRAPVAWAAIVISLGAVHYQDLEALLELLALNRHIDTSFRGVLGRSGHGLSLLEWRLMEAQVWAAGYDTSMAGFPPMPTLTDRDVAAGLVDNQSMDTATQGAASSAGTAVSQRSLQEFFEGSQRRRNNLRFRWAPVERVVVAIPGRQQDRPPRRAHVSFGHRSASPSVAFEVFCSLAAGLSSSCAAPMQYSLPASSCYLYFYIVLCLRVLRVLSHCTIRSFVHCPLYVMLSLQDAAVEAPAGFAVVPDPDVFDVPDTPGAAGSAAADSADAFFSFICTSFLSLNSFQGVFMFSLVQWELPAPTSPSHVFAFFALFYMYFQERWCCCLSRRCVFYLFMFGLRSPIPVPAHADTYARMRAMYECDPAHASATVSSHFHAATDAALYSRARAPFFVRPRVPRCIHAMSCSSS